MNILCFQKLGTKRANHHTNTYVFFDRSLIKSKPFGSKDHLPQKNQNLFLVQNVISYSIYARSLYLQLLVILNDGINYFVILSGAISLLDN